jgi:simple sugar transport system permease protein
MRICSRELKLEKRFTVTGWQAATISILAILIALVLFSIIFFLAGINPLTAYREIFSYAFANPFGTPLTISRFIFLLLCTYAFIIPHRAGLWNIGVAGQLYAGALCVFAVVAALGGKQADANLSPLFVIPLMLIASTLGGALLGAIAGFLKGRYNVNEIVVTMMLNFMAFWVVSFFIKEGGAFMKSGGEGEGFKLPTALFAPKIFGIPFTIIIALGLALLIYYMFAKTRIGYQIRAYGQKPAAARYAGISAVRIPVLVFIMGVRSEVWPGTIISRQFPGFIIFQ